MRISSFSIILFGGLIAGRVLQQSAQLSDNIANVTSKPVSYRQSINSTFKAATQPEGDDLEDEEPEDERFFTDEEREAIWPKDVCRGRKLLHAMVLDENQARSMLKWPHVQSDWDGDMKEELKNWGYTEDDEDGNLDRQCDFAGYHHMTTAFQNLRIDTRSTGMGGPNRCYHFAHRDGPTVLRRPDGSLPDIADQYYEVEKKKYRISCPRLWSAAERALTCGNRSPTPTRRSVSMQETA